MNKETVKQEQESKKSNDTKKSKSANLHNAKKAKNDEFYTRLDDIEAELKNYEHHFKGKKILCNCDDPYESNFVRYFLYNFKKLELKSLTAISYEDSPISKIGKSPYKLEITEIGDDDKCLKDEYYEQWSEEFKQASEIEDKELRDKAIFKCKINTIMRMKGNGEERLSSETTLNDKGEQITLLGGDFRTQASIKALDECDIVVTNPPFSLFREYISLIISHSKKFIVIGSQNAITYKGIFSLLKDNKMWTGIHLVKEFEIPNTATTSKMGNVCWFTNLTIKKHTEKLYLYKHYNPEEYPKYDNYNAINIDKVTDIPCDYYEVMGVPITFMDKYNPEQFEIIGLGITGSCEFTSERKMEILDKNGRPTGKITTNAKGTLYRKYNTKKDNKPAFKDAETGELYTSIYARILIKRKEKETL